MAEPQKFSVDDVNALIPRLEEIFDRIDALQTELTGRSNELERMGAGPGQARHDDPDPDLAERRKLVAEATEALQGQVALIPELGGLLMDLDLGIVSFPSERDGQEVFLSWQRGDDAVQFVHGPDEHFLQQRRRLD